MLSSLGRAIASPLARAWSTLSQVMVKTLTYSEITEKLKNPATLLLDVREVGELSTDGKIHGSRNIPVGEIAAAFKLDNAEFQKKYGFAKPKPTEEVVIHCKSGVRAGNAAKILSESGYSNVLVYPGILDWLKHGGPVEK